MPPTPRREPAFEADTAAAWRAKSQMQVTCPSGAKVVIRALTLDDLAAEEALPDDLLRVAMIEAHYPQGISGEIASLAYKGDPKSLAEVRKLGVANLAVRDRLVRRALVKPEMKTDRDLMGLDPYDKAMIAAISQRQLNVDAAGRKVGADTLDTFRATCEVLAKYEADESRKKVLLELAEIQ
jgi:hypothetical protein